jgi:hypothetical protein
MVGRTLVIKLAKHLIFIVKAAADGTSMASLQAQYAAYV